MLFSYLLRQNKKQKTKEQKNNFFHVPPPLFIKNLFKQDTFFFFGCNRCNSIEFVNKPTPQWDARASQGFITPSLLLMRSISLTYTLLLSKSLSNASHQPFRRAQAARHPSRWRRRSAPPSPWHPDKWHASLGALAKQQPDVCICRANLVSEYDRHISTPAGNSEEEQWGPLSEIQYKVLPDLPFLVISKTVEWMSSFGTLEDSRQKKTQAQIQVCTHESEKWWCESNAAAP